VWDVGPDLVDRDLTWLTPTITLVFGVVLVILSAAAAMLGRRARGVENEAKTTLETKLEIVTLTSGQLARLNDEIQAEFKLLQLETEKLNAEATSARELAAMNPEALAAATAALEAAAARIASRQNKTGLARQWIFTAIGFVLGILASVIASAIWAALTAR
jgi:ABC-type multidrug transport system fused ATPase/permease subunit